MVGTWYVVLFQTVKNVNVKLFIIGMHTLNQRMCVFKKSLDLNVSGTVFK